MDDDPEVSVTPITPDDADKILSGEIKRKREMTEPDKPRKNRGRKSKAEKETEAAARAAEQAKRDAGVDTEGKSLTDHTDEALAESNESNGELTMEDRRTAWALHDAHWS